MFGDFPEIIVIAYRIVTIVIIRGGGVRALLTFTDKERSEMNATTS